MMMYETLASYYDALVGDELVTDFWKQRIQTFIPKGKILEYACGSGDMAIALAKDGHQVVGNDLSEAMLSQAMKKPNSNLVVWEKFDMCEKRSEENFFDGAICLCDSFNYLLEEQQVLKFFQNAHKALKSGGCLIFDTHSVDRIHEFVEEYIETGSVLDVQYEWSIQMQDHFLYSNFLFYDEHQVTFHEQHIQRIYRPNWIEKQLENCGFTWEVFTDFEKLGIHPGEKYFYIAYKGEKQ